MITIHSYAPLCFGGPVIFIVSLGEGGAVGGFFFFGGGGNHMVFRRNEERLSYHLKIQKGDYGKLTVNYQPMRRVYKNMKKPYRGIR